MSRRRSGWPAGLMLAGQTIAAATAVAQAPATPMPQPREFTLEFLDRNISYLRELPWNMTEAPGIPAVDEDGRRMEQDIAEYILTEPALAAITRMRDELASTTAAGAVIPAARLQPLQRRLAVEYCRFTVVGSYWGTRQARAYHHDLIETLIGRLARSQRQEAGQELQAIDARPAAPRAQVVPSLKACDDLQDIQTPWSMAMRDIDMAMEQLAEQYNTLRVKLAAQLDVARAVQGDDWVKRPAPCPAPAPGTSGRSGPAIRSRQDLRDFYPREALQFRVAGPARVQLAYDATGCVTHARVRESTGAEVLDAAALQFTFAMELTPGEADGKPAGGIVMQPIKFTVQDVDLPMSGPPGPAAQPQP